MPNTTQLSENEVLTQALLELGVSAEDSNRMVKDLQMQVGKLAMLELLSRLSAEDYATLREQLANKDVGAQAQLMNAYLEKRFSVEERRQAAEAALQKITPELQKRLSQKMFGIELNEVDKIKLQNVVAKLSHWLALADSSK